MEEASGKLGEKDDARWSNRSFSSKAARWRLRVLKRRNLVCLERGNPYLPFPIKITISYARYHHRAVRGVFQYFWIARARICAGAANSRSRKIIAKILTNKTIYLRKQSMTCLMYNNVLYASFVSAHFINFWDLTLNFQLLIRYPGIFAICIII